MSEPDTKPTVRVGIVTGKEIRFMLNHPFRDAQNLLWPAGAYTAREKNGQMILFSADQEKGIYDRPLFLKPEDGDKGKFTITNVTIGIGFHWQQNEDQVFKGEFHLMPTDSGIAAINVLNVEDYLLSVISSEMKATSTLEMLKAHAVISRSWLLAQIEKGRKVQQQQVSYQTSFITDAEWIKWYDREDHTDFDVCADDHCQRYQGITRATTPLVEQAIHSTRGQILMYQGRICDTRFSKCCGGATELFENVWEPVHHPYLKAIADGKNDLSVDLTEEEQARSWIASTPDAFCNTTDKSILSQVLNDYDQRTNDFYRWKVTYTAGEVTRLIQDKLGIDFGVVQDMIPLQRGASGRIIRLKIIGTLKTLIIGKELEIRKALSSTHLYSSAFFVEKSGSADSAVFTLHGAGWGHGVGLCQIGAAVMGAKGYPYREILLHYFRGAEIIENYGLRSTD